MTLMEHFDPYHKWLGILPEEHPLHHYRLLGIPLLESDPDVIQSAADQRMAYLRTFESGSHSAEARKLLDEVAAARACLLKLELKAAYDRELSKQVGVGTIGPGTWASAALAFERARAMRDRPAE